MARLNAISLDIDKSKILTERLNELWQTTQPFTKRQEYITGTLKEMNFMSCMISSRNSAKTDL